MIVTVTQSTNDDWQEGYTIEIDGTEMLSVFDGEPEDNNLSRNFNDVRSIPALLQLAYEAGLRREELEFEYRKE